MLSHIGTKTLETERLILRQFKKEDTKDMFNNWAIELKENRSVIGSISLMIVDNHNENCEIGYCIGKLWWNKGIVTEAFKKIINFSFNEVGFESITGRHQLDNIASGCVMEKCGLKYEGTLRKIHKINTGMLVDCKYYSILKDEYLY